MIGENLPCNIGLGLWTWRAEGFEIGTGDACSNNFFHLIAKPMPARFDGVSLLPQHLLWKRTTMFHNGCDFRMDPDLDDFRKCPKSIQQMHWGLRKPLQFPPELTSLLTHSTSSSPMRSCRILVRCSCRTTSKSVKKSKPLDALSARSGVLGFRTCGKRYAVIWRYSCSWCHKLKWMVLVAIF